MGFTVATDKTVIVNLTHNFVVKDYDDGVRWIATVEDAKRGHRMKVLSEQPGVQF